MRSATTLPVLMVILGVAGCGAEPDAMAASGSDVGPQVGALLRAYEPTLTEDALELFRAQDLTVHRGRVYIAEAGNDRVTVADTRLQLLHRFGRSGDGPGELRVPDRIEVLASGELAVTEYSGGRVSFFDLDGRYSHSIPYTLPQGSPAALDAHTLVVSGPGGPEPRALRIDGSGVDVFARPGGTAHDPQDLGGDLGAGVIVHGEPGVLLVRDELYTWEVYDGVGELVREDTLPAEIRRGLSEGVAQAEKEWGGALASMAVLQSPTRLDDGRVLFFLALEDPFALVYDPGDGSFLPLHTPEEAQARRILGASYAGDVEGGELFVLSGEGVYVFEVKGLTP